MQALSIEQLPTASLQLNPKNPRRHSVKQIEQIAKSIQAFGFVVPVLVDRNLEVMAGHGRLLAAKSLGINRIPAIRLEHLSEHQKRAFMIADNRLTANSEWDEQLLGEHLKILSEAELDFSVETTGFAMGEIDLFIENLSPASVEELDSADEIPKPSDVQVSGIGDLWQLGRHRLFCGNALDKSSYTTLLGSERAAMVFTDPPYNVPIAGHATGLGAIQHKNFLMASGEMSEAEFTDFLGCVCRLLAAYSMDGSIHFICMDWRHIGELLIAGKQAYSELKNICVWCKDNAGMGSLYRSQHELVFVFKHGRGSHRNNVQLGQYGRYRTNIWQYPGVNSFSRSTEEGDLLSLHPTVKPVALVADAILDCSARGDLILDAFSGSGTTIMAAERTGRRCSAIEIDPLYVDTSIRRWQKFTGLEALHLSSGQTFVQREQEAAHGAA